MTAELRRGCVHSFRPQAVGRRRNGRPRCCRLQRGALRANADGASTTIYCGPRSSRTKACVTILWDDGRWGKTKISCMAARRPRPGADVRWNQPRSPGANAAVSTASARAKRGNRRPFRGRSCAGPKRPVPAHRAQRIGREQGPGQPRQSVVLGVGVRQRVGSLQLHADRKVVAAGAFLEHRFARVPGPLGAADELDQLCVARDQEMGRYAQPAQPGEIRVRVMVQTVREQPLDVPAAELARRQADVVYQQQLDQGPAGRAS